MISRDSSAEWSGSSKIRASGSAKTVNASSKPTPCILKLASAFDRMPLEAYPHRTTREYHDVVLPPSIRSTSTARKRYGVWWQSLRVVWLVRVADRPDQALGEPDDAQRRIDRPDARLHPRLLLLRAERLHILRWRRAR